VAFLREANLEGADLNGAELYMATLTGLNLTGANLTGANLTGANLNGANLADAVFELQQGALPSIPSLALARNLSRLIYQNSPHFLVELRAKAKEYGLRSQERGVTYAIKRGAQERAFSSWDVLTTAIYKYFYPGIERHVSYQRGPRWPVMEDYFREHFAPGVTPGKDQIIEEKKNILDCVVSLAGAGLGYIFFDLTCRWGLDYFRPLLILFVLLLLLAIPYRFALPERSIRNGNHQALAKWRKQSGNHPALPERPKKDGIWRVWIAGRVRSDLGGKEPELMTRRKWRGWGLALYFSLLSAFNIGWRDLNIGGWIARVQPREYRYQATGWVRTLSGLQSIFSVYLLALFVLSYFGRPFESF
jgi:hypothetical protein